MLAPRQFLVKNQNWNSSCNLIMLTGTASVLSPQSGLWCDSIRQRKYPVNLCGNSSPLSLPGSLTNGWNSGIQRCPIYQVNPGLKQTNQKIDYQTNKKYFLRNKILFATEIFYNISWYPICWRDQCPSLFRLMVFLFKITTRQRQLDLLCHSDKQSWGWLNLTLEMEKTESRNDRTWLQWVVSNNVGLMPLYI